MKAMSRILGFAAAAALVLGAAAALAEVSVTGTVTKNKTKTVNETITITKTVDIEVDVKVDLDSAAESQVVKNQDLINDSEGSLKVTTVGDGEDQTLESAAKIGTDADPVPDPDPDPGDGRWDDECVGCDAENAIVGAEGVVQINQSPGILNNQANEGSLVSALETQAFIHSEVAVAQYIGPNPDAEEVPESGAEVSATDANNLTVIDGGDVDGPDQSLDTLGIKGVATVNQAAGDINNQNNSISIAVAPGEVGDDNSPADGVVALGEVDLGQKNTKNKLTIVRGTRSDSIQDGAIDGFQGAVLVNQASGYLNNQANIVNMAIDADVADSFAPRQNFLP